MRIVTNEAFRHRGRRDRAEAGSSVDRHGRAETSDPLIRRERALAVRRALILLPPAQRETLALRHFADLSLAEIAAARGCAVGTVKAALFQACDALRRALPADLHPEA